ncbi:uncharacterized protein LOC115387916 [Salarias fasciatus]|uniref:uncharacterized protein LOC115387916 n=1 Tax=Salarias fasciatus TaxID=181472 RepID=UPI001176515A|nr:uncharacterized protein LOC115387916 [Salarias fasciatus]
MDDGQPQKIPVSIQRGFSIPRLQKCLTCCGAVKYHCPFCLPKIFKPAKRSKVKEHLEYHLKQAFYIGEYTIHRCGLECRAQPHYHCLYCSNMMTTKVNLTNHIPMCIQAQQKRGRRSLKSALRQRRQTSGGSPGQGDAPSDDFLREREEDSDEMIVHSDSQDRRSREGRSGQSELPLVCSSNQTEAAKRHQTVQTDLDKPQDCDEYYFMTLVKMFKKLSPHKKTGIRMTIERLLFEATFQ